MIKLTDGGVCAAKGFWSNGVHVGIRKNPNKLDLALIYSEVEAVCAGVFTTNKAKAAPIILSQEHIKKGSLQAIIVNSGNANSCTGEIGLKHAKEMAQKTALAMRIDPCHVAVASTGVIGVTLPIDKILNGIVPLAKGISLNSNAAAQAIMTTDTFSKNVSIEFNVSGKKVRMGGIAKGSGMIHPNMATMLAFITTDISISSEILQYTLEKINKKTFNMITVDGETSTNDMVIVLANGMANNPEITSLKEPEWELFYNALTYVCQYLAKEIARDGEGATKLIEVRVENAHSEFQAQLAARAICSSPLVKSAVYGEDANWGRIVNALGYSGIEMELNKLSVSLGDFCLFNRGESICFSEEKAKEILSQKTVLINISLGLGSEMATAWGCDLTHGYVDINASYRT